MSLWPRDVDTRLVYSEGCVPQAAQTHMGGWLRYDYESFRWQRISLIPSEVVQALTASCGPKRIPVAYRISEELAFSYTKGGQRKKQG